MCRSRASRSWEGDTALTPEQGSIWSSLSTQIGGIQIRQASAAAKAALLDQAASRLGVKKEELKVADGVVTGGGKRVTYGELIGGKSFSIKLDPKQPVPTKDPKDFKVVGKSVPRVDIPGKATGTFTYMQDFRVSGMLHARVVRPPAIGATLESVDEGSVKDIPTAKRACHRRAPALGALHAGQGEGGAQAGVRTTRVVL
jgi:nicotinate dehydrogenase subunit B